MKRDTQEALFKFDNTRVDNFQGTGGTGMNLQLSKRGAQFYCSRYSAAAYDGTIDEIRADERRACRLPKSTMGINTGRCLAMVHRY